MPYEFQEPIGEGRRRASYVDNARNGLFQLQVSLALPETDDLIIG